MIGQIQPLNFTQVGEFFVAIIAFCAAIVAVAAAWRVLRGNPVSRSDFEILRAEVVRLKENTDRIEKTSAVAAEARAEKVASAMERLTNAIEYREKTRPRH